MNQNCNYSEDDYELPNQPVWQKDQLVKFDDIRDNSGASNSDEDQGLTMSEAVKSGKIRSNSVAIPIKCVLCTIWWRAVRTAVVQLNPAQSPTHLIRPLITFHLMNWNRLPFNGNHEKHLYGTRTRMKSIGISVERIIWRQSDLAKPVDHERIRSHRERRTSKRTMPR